MRKVLTKFHRNFNSMSFKNNRQNESFRNDSRSSRIKDMDHNLMISRSKENVMFLLNRISEIRICGENELEFSYF